MISNINTCILAPEYEWMILNEVFAFEEKYDQKNLQIHDLLKFFSLKEPETVEEEVKAASIKKGANN